MQQFVKIYSDHKNFDFIKARNVARFYARCSVCPSMEEVGIKFKCDRRKVTTYLKVAIIFNLISKEETDKIIDNKCKSHKKYLHAKAKDIKAYEKYVELAEEREGLINKMNKMILMFPGDKNKETIKSNYLPKILEIENKAFR